MMRATTTALLSLLCGVVPTLADNCASQSSQAYWIIDDLVLKVYDWDNGGTTGTFGFKSYYSATNKTVECLAEDVDLAKLGEVWSTCNTPGTEFRFDFTEISLTVKETWTCLDAPGVLFNANSTGLIMLHGCLDNETEGGIESDCNLMEFEMAANVTSQSRGHHHG
ncbi:hypothetical protein QBC35DRAFT_516873 [Podospora australis]|uniref:AA1-like domain-containing protein n=1 Tax=Podospora australis TaxID=1536484 RepID=A0AAN6WNV9_9PEZI|nr:hypothetical protein QBC35DRAFT_516873 [Podospora australis]